MLVTDIVSWKSKTSSETKILCSLGWDTERQEIVILKGRRVGKRVLKGKYLDKRCPENIRYIEATQGRDFIKNLCHGLCGSRVWSTIPYEEDTS
jgi:hypothetical protein